MTGEELHRTLVEAMDELNWPAKPSLRHWANISPGEQKVFDRAAELIEQRP